MAEGGGLYPFLAIPSWPEKSRVGPSTVVDLTVESTLELFCATRTPAVLLRPSACASSLCLLAGDPAHFHRRQRGRALLRIRAKRDRLPPTVPSGLRCGDHWANHGAARWVRPETQQFRQGPGVGGVKGWNKEMPKRGRGQVGSIL